MSVKKLEYETKNGAQVDLLLFLSYLHTSGQHRMEHVRSLLHDPDVSGRGVGALAVLNGVDETVSEFTQRSQEVLLDETDHAVICGSKTCPLNVNVTETI